MVKVIPDPRCGGWIGSLGRCKATTLASGCDLREFRGGKVLKKDTYYKQVTR